MSPRLPGAEGLRRTLGKGGPITKWTWREGKWRIGFSMCWALGGNSFLERLSKFHTGASRGGESPFPGEETVIEP